MRIFNFVGSAVVAAGLTACGGGGDSGGTGNGVIMPDKNYTLIKPTALTSYPSEGTPSTTVARTDYGRIKNTFFETTNNSTNPYAGINTYDGYISEWELSGPSSHLIDTAISTAWNAGWTGKGTSISIIDDFTTRTNKYYSVTNTYTRTKRATEYNGSWSADYSVRYKHFESVSHGGLVSNIAGGDYISEPITENIKYSVYSDSINSTSCKTTAASGYAVGPRCDSTFHDTRNSANSQEDIPATRTRILMPGIASEALVTNNQVDLSNSQDPLETVADIQGHLRNSASYGVINLSIGTEVPTTGRTFNEVMTSVTANPITVTSSAVITVAAGNGGAPCANDDLSGCNAAAVALAFQDATKNSTIVVGALSGTGAQENIATYSTRAGILADRFILAPGTIGYWNSVVGTSFAAPRVAGVAAILKQKYPSLTGEQIANVILLSASKDINNDGTDDFEGVSPVYGHGKLSLSRALALAGAI